MTINEVLQLARNLTHTTAEQVPDATAILWANIEYKKLIRLITTEAQANYFTTTRFLDAMADQTAYANATNMLVLKQVKVKPTSTATDFVISREVDFAKQGLDFNFYKTNQPSNQPLHQLVGTNMWLAPAFTSDTAGTAGNNQIYQEYEKRQDDLAVDGAESTNALPVDFHYVLASGLKPYIYAYIGKPNEKNDALSEYKRDQDEMIYQLSGRDDTKNILSIPNDETIQ